MTTINLDDNIPDRRYMALVLRDVAIEINSVFPFQANALTNMAFVLDPKVNERANPDL